MNLQSGMDEVMEMRENVRFLDFQNFWVGKKYT